MYVNCFVWSTMLVAKSAEMVAKAPIVLSNHYFKNIKAYKYSCTHNRNTEAKFESNSPLACNF